jgi:hypothetical protein
MHSNEFLPGLVGLVHLHFLLVIHLFLVLSLFLHFSFLLCFFLLLLLSMPEIYEAR